MEGRDQPRGNLPEEAQVRTQSRRTLPLNLVRVNEAATQADLGYPREEPYAGKPHVRMCVQKRLMCSAGVSPAGVRAEAP